tara:strand:- start:7154 stop:8077 length:924 start_codon:yes stop_codon:yes gene_type:complete
VDIKRSLAASLSSVGNFLKERMPHERALLHAEDTAAWAQVEVEVEALRSTVAFVSESVIDPESESAEVIEYGLGKGAYTKVVEEGRAMRAEKVRELLDASYGWEIADKGWKTQHLYVKRLVTEGHNADSKTLKEAQGKASRLHRAQRLLSEPRTLALAYLAIPFNEQRRKYQANIRIAEDRLKRLAGSVRLATDGLRDHRSLGANRERARINALKHVSDLNKEIGEQERRRDHAVEALGKIDAAYEALCAKEIAAMNCRGEKDQRTPAERKAAKVAAEEVAADKAAQKKAAARAEAKEAAKSKRLPK